MHFLINRVIDRYPFIIQSVAYSTITSTDTSTSTDTDTDDRIDETDELDYYAWMSSNPNISYKKDVLPCPEKWYYIYLSSNPAVTWDDVKSDPNRPWNTQELSCNPSIRYSNILEAPHRLWDYQLLSSNRSALTHAVKVAAADTIRAWWQNILYNPGHKVGRRYIRSRT